MSYKVTASLNVLYVFDICDLKFLLTYGLLLFFSIEQDPRIPVIPPPIRGFPNRKVKAFNLVVID